MNLKDEDNVDQYEKYQKNNDYLPPFAPKNGTPRDILLLSKFAVAIKAGYTMRSHLHDVGLYMLKSRPTCVSPGPRVRFLKRSRTFDYVVSFFIREQCN